MNPRLPLQFGKYWLTDRIAVGGMAELYRGKIAGEEGFEKAVAVKKILPHLSDEKEAVNYFIDEARLAALLQHPNIAQIYDFGRLEDSYFIAMEYLFGKDLKTVLKASQERGMPLSLEHALHIAAGICAGLDYAHALKDLRGQLLHITHRDVSPQNIFLTYDGQVKIIDFGIAKAASRITNTRSGVIKGKVAYMSPEQAEGHDIDHRSDIFSVGILLYEMVTGRFMYEGDAMDILSRAREARFTRAERIVRDLPECLVVVLDMALAKDPGDRYGSCGEMLGDLEDCIYHLQLRPNGQKLSFYMKGLFDQERRAEEASLVWSLRRRDPLPDSEENPGAASGTAPGYQETMILAPEIAPSPGRGSVKRWGWWACILMVLAAAGGWVYYDSRSTRETATVIRIPISNDAAGNPSSESAAADVSPADPLIARWLQDAQHNLEAWNLTAPEKRNAFYFYQEVLKRDPGNAEASRGLVAIAERYARLAERELERANYPKASEFVATGLTVAADHTPLRLLKEKIHQRASLDQQRRIQHLLVQANDCLNAYKLTKPDDDNALHYYREIEKIDPANGEARRGIRKIADRYALLAEKEMNSFAYDSARRYITTGLNVDPGHHRLLELQTEVNKRLDQRVLRSLKNLFD